METEIERLVTLIRHHQHLANKYKMKLVELDELEYDKELRYEEEMGGEY